MKNNVQGLFVQSVQPHDGNTPRTNDVAFGFMWQPPCGLTMLMPSSHDLHSRCDAMQQLTMQRSHDNIGEQAQQGLLKKSGFPKDTPIIECRT
jgi:hypothetical protein